MTLTDLGMALAVIGFLSLAVSMICASLNLYACEHTGWLGFGAMLGAAAIFIIKLLGIG